MKTQVFSYDDNGKPFPESLSQGIYVSWDIKTRKRQMWVWGFSKMNEEEIKEMVKFVLKDIIT